MQAGTQPNPNPTFRPLSLSQTPKMSANFSQFYESWLDNLQVMVSQLSSALRPTPTTGGTPTSRDHHLLHSQVQKVMSHFADYYRVKSLAVDNDALAIFAAPWATTLERSLHWIAGWRPTTAFHLVYSESSILFESRIVDILRGIHTGDLGDLSPSQFRLVSDLQCQTVKEENAITEELSEWQDGASELIGESSDFHGSIGRLGIIIKEADTLRLKTVRKVVELLTPQQAAEYLIAGAELQFGVRVWGTSLDLHRSSE